MSIRRRLCVATVGTMLITLAGCYVEEEPAQPARTVSEPTEQRAPAGSETVGRGGGSTLGGAKRSAERTVGDLEARDRELQKQMEDDDR